MPGEEETGGAPTGRRFAPKVPASRRRRAAQPEPSRRSRDGPGNSRGSRGGSFRGRGRGAGDEKPRDVVTFGGELAFGQVEAASKARRATRSSARGGGSAGGGPVGGGPSKSAGGAKKEESTQATPAPSFAAEKHLETEYDSEAEVDTEENRMRSSVPPGFAPLSVPARASILGEAKPEDSSFEDDFPVDSVAYQLASAARTGKPSFYQLPSTLPFGVPIDEALQSVLRNEPIIQGSKLDMVPPHALRPDLRLMKAGVISVGKLRLFRSGKVQIVILGPTSTGDTDRPKAVIFDVLGGSHLPSEHNLVQIDLEEAMVMSLSQVDRKFVCIPRLDGLADDPS